MSDISGQGLEVNVRASITFPSGVNINQFADDSDPLDSPAVEIAQVAMGLNGDLITWNVANPIPMVLNVIPGSDDDENLEILANANRVSRNKRSAKDQITAVISYPDGEDKTLTVGKITNAPMISSVASAGRKKTKTYTFAFEHIA